MPWAPRSIQSRWFTNVRASPRDQPHLESTRVRPSRNATVISYAGLNFSWGRKSWIACFSFCRYVYYLSQPNPAVIVTPTIYAKMPQARISTSSSNWMNTILLWFCLRVIQLGIWKLHEAYLRTQQCVRQQSWISRMNLFLRWYGVLTSYAHYSSFTFRLGKSVWQQV